MGGAIITTGRCPGLFSFASSRRNSLLLWATRPNRPFPFKKVYSRAPVFHLLQHFFLLLPTSPYIPPENGGECHLCFSKYIGICIKCTFLHKKVTRETIFFKKQRFKNKFFVTLRCLKKTHSPGLCKAIQTIENL